MRIRFRIKLLHLSCSRHVHNQKCSSPNRAFQCWFIILYDRLMPSRHLGFQIGCHGLWYFNIQRSLWARLNHFTATGTSCWNCMISCREKRMSSVSHGISLQLLISNSTVYSTIEMSYCAVHIVDIWNLEVNNFDIKARPNWIQAKAPTNHCVKVRKLLK